MRGRPKKDDTRVKQYRVRLNDEEDKMLAYVSEVVGKQKSEIFRQALVEYYNNVRIREMALKEEEQQFVEDGISLKRVIDCPYCGAPNAMDFEDDCDAWSEERQMGPEITHNFDWDECECEACGKQFHVSGYICEYPVGMYNYESIKIEKSISEKEEEGR